MKTDSHLQKDVQEELKWWPSAGAAHIGVAADHGVVTLSGQVNHYAQKTKAEERAKAVYGVKGIANEIVVEPAGSFKKTDKDIVDAALSSLAWNSDVPGDTVTVVVSNGWITLTGTVDWQYEKDAANRCVHYLTGAKGVTNSIVVKPKAKWVDVKNEIEASFRRNAVLDARRIQVLTNKNSVTLAGSVSSWSEHDEAVSAAWSAPGVTSVVDDLLVTM